MTTQHNMRKKALLAPLAGALATLILAGCGSPDAEDGEVIDEIPLPTGLVLGFTCPDAGLAFEDCILADPENPFRNSIIREFDERDPGAENKFDLANQIPASQDYAISRYYFWATALARFPSGENQYRTALALHELWDAQVADGFGDPIIQEQALRAYRSVLDNFFGSVTFFIFSYVIDGDVVFCGDNCPPPNFDPDRGDRSVPVSFVLNELTADNLYREASTGYTRLIPGDPILTLEEISSWGFTYQPCVEITLPDSQVVCQGGVISVSEF